MAGSMVQLARDALAQNKKVELSAGCFEHWQAVTEIETRADGLIRVVVDAPARPEVFMIPTLLGAVRVTG